jgi:hypothetical protein
MQFFVERYLTDEERIAFGPIQRQMRALLDPVTVDVHDYLACRRRGTAGARRGPGGEQRPLLTRQNRGEGGSHAPLNMRPA